MVGGLPSLDTIRTFHTVAQTGSLSAAARELGLTQPTVGRHIDLLEEDLGLPLFVRSREGMRLTEKGEGLIASASELMTSAQAFDRVAAGMGEELAGPVRISANEIFGIQILPGMISEMSLYHRSSMILVKLTAAVSAHAMFCPTPGAALNLAVTRSEPRSWYSRG